MVSMNPFAREQEIMGLTIGVIDGLSVIAILYFLIVLAGRINGILALKVDLIFMSGILATLVVIGFAIFDEFIFRDYFLWSFLTLYNGSVKHGYDFMGRGLRKFALMAIKVSMLENVPDVIKDNVPKRYKEEIQIAEKSSGVGIHEFAFSVLFFVFLAILASFIYYLLWILVVVPHFGGDARGLVALWSAFIIPVPIEFMYSVYGNRQKGTMGAKLKFFTMGGSLIFLYYILG